MPKISQLEARRLKKRVAELESILEKQKAHWSHQWPGGVHIGTVTVQPYEWHIADTARRLGHAVVVVPAEFPKLHIYGCPLPK